MTVVQIAQRRLIRNFTQNLHLNIGKKNINILLTFLIIYFRLYIIKLQGAFLLPDRVYKLCERTYTHK